MKDSLRYLSEIIEHGNFTRAAESLFISQPALSRFVSRIEQSEGIRIFDRASQPLLMTPEGKRYYEYLIAIDRLHRQLESDLADMGQLSDQSIRLGATRWRSQLLLPEVLPRLLQKRPNLMVSFFGLSNSDLMRLVRMKNIDLAIMSVVQPGFGVDFYKVAEEEIVVTGTVLEDYIKSHDGLLHSGSVVSAVQLKLVLQGQRLILQHPDHSLGADTRDFLAKLGIRLRKTINGDSIGACVKLAAKSSGLAFVPIQAVLRGPDHQLPFLRIQEADLKQTIGLAWPSDMEPTGVVAELAQLLENQILEDFNAYQQLI